jgi:osmotically-inducible protein OsmY
VLRITAEASRTPRSVNTLHLPEAALVLALQRSRQDNVVHWKVTMISTKFALVVLSLAVGAAGCAQPAQGVVTDTKENTAAVRGAVETLDVKTAIIADKTIDSGAIDVDTFQDKKLVVLRGSVPTEAQKAQAEQIARKHATGYTVENRLAVVPNK